MKQDNNFIVATEKEYEKYNLSMYSNFHKSGDIDGMRNLYYGKEACLVQAGDYIYHVDKEIFDKIKAELPVKAEVQQQAEVTEKIKNYLTDFVEKWDESPDIAEVTVKYRDGEELHTQIALNERTGDLMDEEVMFTCTSIQEFKKLAEVDNGEDFHITDIHGFYVGEYQESEQNQTKLQEIISDIAINIGAELTKYPNLEYDSRELVKNICKWAEEFEQKFKNENPEEVDYITEVDKFAEQKWNAYIREEEQTVEEKIQEPVKLYNADELEKRLKEKYPDGLTLNIRNFNVDSVYSYLFNGNFDGENTIKCLPIGENKKQEDDYLQAEIHVSPEEYLYLIDPNHDTYYNKEFEQLKGLELAIQDYSPLVTALLNRHPDLQGAELTVQLTSKRPNIKVEGEPFDKVISWALQNLELTEEGEQAKKELERIGNIPSKDFYVQNPKLNLPDKMHMIRNRDCIYLFEQGILGHAAVDKYRGVVFSGETLSQQAQEYINDLVLAKNINTEWNNMFFNTPGAGCERRAFLNTTKDKLELVDLQKDIYGRTFYTIGAKILDEGYRKNLVDITGRVTDATIIGGNKPMIRCKIDGVQQSTRALTKNDVILMGHYKTGQETTNEEKNEMAKFSMSMAVKHFSAELCNGQEQQQSKGMKR